MEPIQERAEHQTLLEILHQNKFKGYVSIEMGKQDDIGVLLRTIDYLKMISEVYEVYDG